MARAEQRCRIQDRIDLGVRIFESGQKLLARHGTVSRAGTGSVGHEAIDTLSILVAPIRLCGEDLVVKRQPSLRVEEERSQPDPIYQALLDRSSVLTMTARIAERAVPRVIAE